MHGLFNLATACILLFPLVAMFVVSRQTMFVEEKKCKQILYAGMFVQVVVIIIQLKEAITAILS